VGRFSIYKRKSSELCRCTTQNLL